MDPAQRRQQDWKTMHQYSVLHAMDGEKECFFLVLPMLFYPPLGRFPNPLASWGTIHYKTLQSPEPVCYRAARLILFEHI